MTLRARSRTRIIVLALAGAMAIGSYVLGPSLAFGQMGEDRPILIQSDTERHIYAKLRCMCGGCARLDLETCTCSYAADRRAEIHAELAGGMTPDEVIQAYVKRFGTDSLEIPSNEGANKLLYIVPIVIVLAGAVGLGFLLKRLRGGGPPSGGAAGGGASGGKAKRDEYDDKLDDELKRMDD